MAKDFDSSQHDVLRAIGLATVRMANETQVGNWREVRILARRHETNLNDSPQGWTIETTLTLNDGMQLPLAARPAVIDALKTLSDLFALYEKPWRGLDYRIAIGQDRQLESSCRYSYDPDGGATA
jgi:hypothetical protein